MNTVVYSDYYKKDKSRLTEEEQFQLEGVEREIRYNRLTPGRREETIKCRNGRDVHSFRVNRDIRLAVYLWKSDEYMFLMCDHHDELYNRLRRVNLNTVKEGEPPIIEMVIEVEHRYEHTYVVSTPSVPIPQFSNRLKDLAIEKIVALGVSGDLAQQLQNAKSEDELLELFKGMSERSSSALIDVNDNPRCYDNTLARLQQPERPRRGIEQILKESPEARQHYFILTDELRPAFLNGTLEDWQVFLHPTQTRAIEMQANGPMMVTGPAGTGKTVVAVHRIKWLLRNQLRNSNKKILFTTFTRTLAKNARILLQKVCTPEEMARVDVFHFDEYVRNLISKTIRNTRILYETGTIDFKNSNEPYARLIREACKDVNLGQRDLAFIAREFEGVITEYNIQTKDAYLEITRPKVLGVLQQTTREKLWPIFEYLNTHIYRYACVPRAVAINRLIRTLPSGNCEYATIVVDEAQDMGAPEYRLFAHLTGNTSDNPRANSLVFTGDGHQRIYGRIASLKDCGINVKNRSVHLTTCYRSTRKIREYAERIIAGVSVENMDKERDSLKNATSIEEGVPPEVCFKASISQKSALVRERLNAWVKGGVKLKDCAILVREERSAFAIKNDLCKYNLAAEVITRTRGELNADTIKVMTMHRAKGLQFVNVIVDVTRWPYMGDDLEDEVAKAESLQQEKCLLYMAIMRAMNNVLIVGLNGQQASNYLPKVEREALRPETKDKDASRVNSTVNTMPKPKATQVPQSNAPQVLKPQEQPKVLSADEWYAEGKKWEVNRDAYAQKEMVKCFRAAANLDHVRAMYKMGLCYEYGSGEQKSARLAVDWYQKAANGGDEDAKDRLEIAKNTLHDRLHRHVKKK